MSSLADSTVRIFERLQLSGCPPADPNLFVAALMPGRSGDYIAKDTNGRPAFLISSVQDGSEPRIPPIALEHLRIDHGLACRLTESNGSVQEGLYSVIRCISGDAALQLYFVRTVTTIIESLPASPTQLELEKVINCVVELFRQMSLAPRKTIQGLWAELLLIARATEPCLLIGCWHENPDDLYDFGLGKEKLEVKSTAGGIRRHHFSFNQLNPTPGTTVVVASVFVEVVDDGVSVFNLVESIKARIQGCPELASRIDQIVAATLGSGWRQALEAKFDLELANKSLRFYSSSAIPSVSAPLDPAISDVHFTSDLSDVKSLDGASLVSKGILLGCALDFPH
ncbi:MAG: PD-(D/E)XK motif protein [Ignavibacteria bacterium]|nr:PD-(D/E)XK motif protein [Ignavibacteria bacterium]